MPLDIYLKYLKMYYYIDNKSLKYLNFIVYCLLFIILYNII